MTDQAPRGRQLIPLTDADRAAKRGKMQGRELVGAEADAVRRMLDGTGALPMSVVRHQLLHEALATPPVAPTLETNWRAIAQELMEEVDRRGDELQRLRDELIESRASAPPEEGNADG